MAKLTAFLALASLVLAAFAPGCHGANILFYSGICTASHITAMVPVMDRLAEHGHNVTLVTPYLPKRISPKVNVHFSEEIYNVFKDQWDKGADLIQVREAGISLWSGLVDNALGVCRMFLEAPGSQALIHDSEFDLVVVDSSFNECAVGLSGLKYKCPYILWSAPPPFPSFHDELGLAIEASSIPDIEGRAMGGDHMSFWERVDTVWLPLKWLWRRYVEYYPKLNALLRETLRLPEGTEVDIGDLQGKASLVLLNSHYSTAYARSLPPLFVPIGGVGIVDKRTPLPKELDAFLSRKGSKGFVYVCFGGAVMWSKSKPALRSKIFGAFAQFPEIQFVWKWDGEVPRDDGVPVPENVYFASWLPQQDLLADKRCKGFIGHGGVNGIVEATHYAVPGIFMPVFGEQDHNAQAMATKRLAKVIDIADFTQEELRAALEEVLHDKELHARVQQASRVSRDRPQEPLETAVWWIEYVLRHKGDTRHLMPLATAQPWWKKRLLDIWFVAFALGTLGLLVPFFLLLAVMRARSRRGAARYTGGYTNGSTVTNGHSTNGNAKSKKKIN